MTFQSLPDEYNRKRIFLLISALAIGYSHPVPETSTENITDKWRKNWAPVMQGYPVMLCNSMKKNTKSTGYRKAFLPYLSLLSQSTPWVAGRDKCACILLPFPQQACRKQTPLTVGSIFLCCNHWVTVKANHTVCHLSSQITFSAVPPSEKFFALGILLLMSVEQF